MVAAVAVAEANGVSVFADRGGDDDGEWMR